MLHYSTINDKFRPIFNHRLWQVKLCKNKKIVLANLTSGNLLNPDGKTAANKYIIVDMMTDQISNWALNVIPRNNIPRDGASINEVWKKLCLFFNMESIGSLLNEVWNVSLEPYESPQDLYT